MSDYTAFLESKRLVVPAEGITVAASDLHPALFGFQRDLTRWALRKGRAALFCHPGLGKTLMQLAWTEQIARRSLILAPLAVAQQTVREGAKFGISVAYARRQSQAAPQGITVTNYEMLSHFDPALFDAVVLDESSILRSFDGKTRTALIQAFKDTPYRLCCTATPAPNDIAEIANHAEFLGVMSRVEMLASFFVHDEGGWRLKGHAAEPFYRWLASWGMSLTLPSDLGYPDDGFELPPLAIQPELVPVDVTPPGQLFFTTLHGIQDRIAVRRATLDARVARVIEIVNASHTYLIGNPPDKLAVRCGSRSTQNSDGPSINPIQRTENAERPKADHLNPTASTCSSITQRTASNTPNSDDQKLRNGDDEAESGTLPTQNTERDARPSHDNATRTVGETAGSFPPTESTPQPTTRYSTSKVAAAQSAEYGSQTVAEIDSTLTTVTIQDASVACFVEDATSELDGSTTIPHCSDEQQITLAPLPEPWVVWCGLDAEQHALEASFGERAISIYGSLSPEQKATRLLAWLNGERPILITKPTVAGYGLNMQHCARMAFVGLSDSYEQYFQAIRRCHRFGQEREVRVWVVLSEAESEIYRNVLRKERDAARLTRYLVRHVASFEQEELAADSGRATYAPKQPMRTPAWLRSA